MTCVVNRVHDEFRSKRSQMLELDKAGPISANSEPPDISVVTTERTRLLIDALAMIPFEQREVIIMRLKGGMKLREIARVQKTSLNTVHGRYRYGLEKLRRILDEKSEI